MGAEVNVNPELCQMAGFSALELLLPEHVANADCYLAMIALLAGQPVRELPHCDKMDMDRVWTVVFGLELSR